jgi:hypothetical protein
MFAPNRFATGLCWSRQQATAAGKDAPPSFNRNSREKRQASEDNNPAHRSRNLYDYNTTRVFDSNLDMTFITALQIPGVRFVGVFDHRWSDQKLRSDESP